MEVVGVEREMVYPCVPGPLKLLELSNNAADLRGISLFFLWGEKGGGGGSSSSSSSWVDELHGLHSAQTFFVQDIE
jgi:hypothetical protein